MANRSQLQSPCLRLRYDNMDHVSVSLSPLPRGCQGACINTSPGKVKPQTQRCQDTHSDDFSYDNMDSVSLVFHHCLKALKVRALPIPRVTPRGDCSVSSAPIEDRENQNPPSPRVLGFFIVLDLRTAGGDKSTHKSSALADAKITSPYLLA
jgi:hypothetical protein